MNAPCKDCPDRVFPCWNTCEKYKKWLAEKHEREAKKREYNKPLEFIADSVEKTRKMLRKTKRR